MKDLILEHHIAYPSVNDTLVMSKGKMVNGKFRPGKYESEKAKWQTGAWMNFKSQMRQQGHGGFDCKTEVFITLSFKSSAQDGFRDYNNYAPKWLMDVLKSCKAIKDDSAKWCYQNQVVFVDGMKEDKITIRIKAHG